MSQVNVCVGNATEVHCTDRAILNHWTKYVFFEYETMYKVQETINPKHRADSFYVSEIKCSYLIFVYWFLILLTALFLISLLILFPN